MVKTLSVLGSTGSIGRQSLEVADALGIGVAALTAHRSAERLEQQCRKYRPRLAVCTEERAGRDLKVKLADTPVKVLTGPEGLLEAATVQEADTVLTAVMGMVGLKPTLAALEGGKQVALANKETLVCGGELVMEQAQKKGARILPVDSEHSAIFQCLQGHSDLSQVRRLILTASGGPFFGKTRGEMEHMTAAEALKHPNWSMGAKITVDSATMMNKGLEVIEAMRLYGLPLEKISVVIHRESIVHSLVEYCDNAILAQLGTADMRLPIQYAMTWPERRPGPAKPLDLLNCGELTFRPPDYENFPCLALAREAARTGGTATAVLNGANEAAVELFLAGAISFGEIARRVERAMAAVPAVMTPTLEQVLEADAQARRAAVLS